MCHLRILEKVENIYAICPVVQQIMVHGDSMESYLLAIATPDHVQPARTARRDRSARPIR